MYLILITIAHSILIPIIMLEYMFTISSQENCDLIDLKSQSDNFLF